MNKAQPLTREALLSDHPLPLVVDGDKDSKGRVLVVAGSRRTPGAALLCATAAMRSGAGRSRIVCVDSLAIPLGIAMPEAMVIGLAEAHDGGFAKAAAGEIARQAEKADVVVAGPGLARAQTCGAIAEALEKPGTQLVLDAAILHSLQPPVQDASRSGPPPILLPHAGELASMLDCAQQAVEQDPVGCGLQAAERYRAVVLVKGVVSHVITPEKQVWTFEGGSAGLGVSGSGDALAGIVGGLAARCADPLTALLWGVLLHGEAGAALERRIGPVGFLAREIADEIPALLKL